MYVCRIILLIFIHLLSIYKTNSFDHSKLQATFKVTLTVPSDLTALSNMPVENEKLDGELKTLYFEESPNMSTYLVAVVIGLFDHIEDRTSTGMQMSLSTGLSTYETVWIDLFEFIY